MTWHKKFSHSARHRRHGSLCALLLVVTGSARGAAAAPTIEPLLAVDDAVVDVDAVGDRLLVVGEHSCTWYRWNHPQMIRGGVWSDSRLLFLHGDLLDLTGDGRPEILITALRGARLASFVLSMDERPRRIARDLPWYLRVEEGTLYGQRRGTHAVFHGPVEQLAWHRETLRAVGRHDLPRGTTIYHFQPVSETEVVRVMTDGRQQVWERRNGRWHRAKRFASSWRGISARTLPATTSLYGDAIATPLSLGLPALPLHDGWLVATQRPVLGEMIGRRPYFTSWELHWVSNPASFVSAPGWQRRGEGGVTAMRGLDDHRALLAVRQGDAGPLDTDAGGVLFLFTISR
ncbi:MAG: hypothetical protein HYV02_05025 [Deltaproteobacteria bacterium]|nr:hypothetical protein [Deltaproteobacteria bacterium]